MPSQPTTAELQAVLKKTLTSAAFAKFMGDLVQTAIADSQAQVPGIVLPPVDALLPARFTYSTKYSLYSKRNATDTHMIELQCDPFSSELSVRGIWYGTETRFDQQGQKWERWIGLFVMDDFGNLVEVPK